MSRNFGVPLGKRPDFIGSTIEIVRLKLRYFGHVMRAYRSLEWDIMLRQVEGHRKQGKPRMRWLDIIKEATGLRLEDLREAVQDREKMAYTSGRKDSVQRTHKCEVNSGEGNGKPLLYS
jgi:hypothetical protein